MQHFDAIVLGVGGVGSSALDHFARRGLRVVGLDRFPTAHAKGSAHGQTRLIRQAYFEHPDYVPLLKRAYALWEDLEARTGESLYCQSGVLQVGPRGGRIIDGVLASAQQHQLAIDELTPREVTERFPGFVVPDSVAAVLETRAGFLYVEDCIRAATAQAVQAGATLKTDETVQGWSAAPGRVEVVTDKETYTASHLVITAGSWAADFLADLGIKFEVVRKSLYWFEPQSAVYHVDNGAPGFIIETPAGNFYGFPQIDDMGVKVAEHTGGYPVPDPLAVDRTEHTEETERVTDFLADYLPEVSTRQKHFDVCLYTLSPDRNFVVDRHSEYPNVSFAAGLSGHGFKFASVLGEVLADLSMGLPTSAPVDFLSCRRSALFTS